jgi:hypothetical protein
LLAFFSFRRDAAIRAASMTAIDYFRFFGFQLIFIFIFFVVTDAAFQLFAFTLFSLPFELFAIFAFPLD